MLFCVSLEKTIQHWNFRLGRYVFHHGIMYEGENKQLLEKKLFAIEEEIVNYTPVICGKTRTGSDFCCCWLTNGAEPAIRGKNITIRFFSSKLQFQQLLSRQVTIKTTQHWYSDWGGMYFIMELLRENLHKKVTNILPEFPRRSSGPKEVSFLRPLKKVKIVIQV